MKNLHVDLAERSYDIRMDAGLLERAGQEIRAVCPRAKKIFVVSDSNVAPLYYNPLKASLLSAGFDEGLCTIPAGERSKSAAQLTALWEDMMDFGLTRTDAVVALGGGVVGDLAGFAAATILRGVDFVQIPTTLLSQVDSSVGGKVAIDLEHGKNLAGNFYQPRLVLMDTQTLHTLTDKTFSDGMAEVIKYGCIADGDFFDFLAAHPTRQAVMEHIEHVLYTCCDIKRQVVEADEHDTGLRMILNFGHTVGHAFEKMGGYEVWTHGQAVAAGMCIAAQMGVRLGLTAPEAVQPILDLCNAFCLPVSISLGESESERNQNWEIVVETIGLDKKSTGDEVTMIFLEQIGKALPHKMKKDDLLNMLSAIYRRA